MPVAFFCLALAPAAAGAVEAGAGASATAGSGGYRRLGLFADASWTGAKVEPFGWTEADFSNELRRFELGAGAWDNWTKTARGKAGVGLAGGRYDDGRGANALIAVLGAERDAGRATLGADWRLDYGTLSSSDDAPDLERSANARANGRRRRGEEQESSAVNELGAYGRLAVDGGVLGLRLGAVFPPLGETITSETASFRVPVGSRLWITPSVTLEQGSANAVYFSLSAYCRL
jgi:hypothetical protein